MTSARSRSPVAFPMLVGVAATALLLSPDRAWAQRGWDEVETVSQIVTSVGAARLAVDVAGGVTVVWTEPAGAARVVKAIHRPADGTWTMATPLGTVPDGNDLVVAAGAAPGEALVVWTGRDGGVYGWRRSIYGAWDAETVAPARAGVVARAPALAVDGAGHALALWQLESDERIEAARYDAGSHTWGAVAVLGYGVRPVVDMDDAGNAVAAWADRSVTPRAMVAARFTAGTGQWAAPVVVHQNAVVIGLDVDVAPDGTAAVLWYDEDVPRTRSALSVSLALPPGGTWSAPSVLSTTSPTGAVAVGGDHAMAVWTTGQGAMFSRADVSSGPAVWTTPALVAPSLAGPSGLTFAVGADELGDVVATWTVGGSGYGSQYSRTSGWAAAERLSPPGVTIREPAVLMATTGTATVAWAAEQWPYGAVQATAWDATLDPPTLLSVSPSPGTLTVAFTSPPATLPEFAALNVEYSIDGGTTWVPRTPPALTSPLVVTGLADGTSYALRLRTVNAGGSGPGSPGLGARPGVGVLAPLGLAVSDVEGGIVTFTWAPPAVGADPRAYRIEGGVLPGQTLAAIDTTGATPILRVPLAPGVYYVRVRALILQTVSGPSDEVRIVVGSSEPPSAPSHLLGLVNGSTVALSWTPTFDGGTPDRLSLLVEGPVSGVLPLGLVETFRYDAVPPGTYTFRVVASNAAGASAPSLPLTLTFPAACSGPPLAPTRVRVTAVGTTITVRWSAPETGPAVTAYGLIVGTPGDTSGGHHAAPPAYLLTVPVAGRQITGTVPPDFYTFFVYAVNDCGVGAAAGPLTIDVP